MSVENIPEINNNTVDGKLTNLGEGVENITRIHELYGNLDGKQTFIATQLIENSFMGNTLAKKMLLASYEE